MRAAVPEPCASVIAKQDSRDPNAAIYNLRATARSASAAAIKYSGGVQQPHHVKTHLDGLWRTRNLSLKQQSR